MFLIWVLPLIPSIEDFQTINHLYNGITIYILLVFLLALLVQLFIGRSFYVSAFHAVRSKSLNMDVLIALGTSCAFLYGLVLLTIGYNHEDGEEHKHRVKEHAHLFETSSLLLTII